MDARTFRKWAIVFALIAVFVSQFMVVGHTEAKGQACRAVDLPGEPGVFMIACPAVRR